jgi:transcriptional regulator with XRE-family HTH domain
MGDRGPQRIQATRPSLPPDELDPRGLASVVGASIRGLRQERGWTQVDLATAWSLSPNYIARLERGELGPSLLVALQIAGALGVDVNTLIAPPAGRARSGRRRSL